MLKNGVCKKNNGFEEAHFYFLYPSPSSLRFLAYPLSSNFIPLPNLPLLQKFKIMAKHLAEVILSA